MTCPLVSLGDSTLVLWGFLSFCSWITFSEISGDGRYRNRDILNTRLVQSFVSITATSDMKKRVK